MAWTSPKLWVTGELVTASMMNTYLSENTAELRVTPANRCEAYHNTTQTGITSEVALNLNSEVYDTAAMHDNVTNNSRITIPAGGSGMYLCVGQTLATIANGAFYLRKNGTKMREASQGAGLPTYVVIGYLSLSAGDYIDLAAAGMDTAGSATAIQATRLTVAGPLPPS